MSHAAITLLFPLLSLPATGALEVRGRVYPLRGDQKLPAYHFKSQVRPTKDGWIAVNSYEEPGGRLILREESEIVKDRLLRYDYRQEQVSDFGNARVEGGKVKMSFTEEGKTETETEDDDPALIVAPMIEPLIGRSFGKLMQGETIRVRYLAVERLETIGFKFFKSGERSFKGEPAVDILMKPSSFFIAALVSPVRITVSKAAPHRILESEGRTPIRSSSRQPPKKRGDWRAIDARIEYDAPLPASR